MRIVGNAPSGGKKPTTPTIGTATDDGTGTGVSVAFTPSTYIGKGTITYTATSSPGSLTGTGSGSPITVSGLTTGTAYTFTVQGATNYGVNSDASAASNSVTPASPSSYESIATFTANGSANSYTFSSIPGTYKSLQIRAFLVGGTAVASTNLDIQINADTGTNYAIHWLNGNGASVTASGAANNPRIEEIITFGTTNQNAAVIIDLIDYASTSKFKTIRSFAGRDNNGSGNVRLSSGLWRSTSAITSINLYSDNAANIPSGTSFALYGIK
jgi:hypothetical protein